MQDIINKAKENDKKAIEKLLNDNKKVIQSKVSKYYVKGMEREDLEQEASIAFLDCIKTFNPEENDNFPAFASLCIERRLITILTSSQRQKNMALNTSLSLDKMISITDEDNILFLDLLESDEDTTEEKLIKQERLKELKKKTKSVLSIFEQDVLEEYLKGYSYKEIAENFDTNEKAIDNAIQRIRNKLNKEKLL